MIRINVNVKVKPENRQRVTELLQELARASRQEKGCHGYDILTNCTNPDLLMIAESWENASVLSAHEHSEHFTRLIPEVLEFAELDIQKYTNGTGVEEAIINRRSIREFLPGNISFEVIERLLKAGMYARSAGDRRPWEFLIIEDKAHLEALSKMSPHGQPIAQASAAIILCCNTKTAGLDGVFWPQDLGACAQNIMLQAYAEGLGTLWVGLYPKIDRVHLVKEHFTLSNKLIPFAVIAIGKPAHPVTETPDRFEPGKIHYK